MFLCALVIRKQTHRPQPAEAPGVSAVAPLCGHMHLSRRTTLKSDKASYSSAHQTRGSENPSPWKTGKTIFACLWCGYLWQCCPSVRPPKLRSAEPLDRCKPNPPRTPRSSEPDLCQNPRCRRAETSGPAPRGDPSAAGEKGAGRGRRAGAGVTEVSGTVLWGTPI